MKSDEIFLMNIYAAFGNWAHVVTSSFGRKIHMSQKFGLGQPKRQNKLCVIISRFLDALASLKPVMSLTE